MRLDVLAQDEASNKTSMKGEELVEILKGEVDHKEKDVAQSGVISKQVGVLCIRGSKAVRSEMMAEAIEADMHEHGPCSVRCSCVLKELSTALLSCADARATPGQDAHGEACQGALPRHWHGL